jgi:hypothetical protein
MKHTLMTTTAAMLLMTAGCATIQPARMALPATLADATATEQLPLQGLGGKAQGTLQVGNASGRYERSNGQLALLDALVSFNRGSARYTLQAPGTQADEAECQARQTDAQRGILALPVRPWAVNCVWKSGARLALHAEVLAAGGTQDARQGRYEAAGVTLELRSVHRLQGTKLPLAQAAGYTLLHQGVVVGALELTDSTPRLWRPRAGQPHHDAVTQAALALALVWDPSRL